MAAIGGFRSDLSITRKTDGNFGNNSAGVLTSKVGGGNVFDMLFPFLAFLKLQPIIL